METKKATNYTIIVIVIAFAGMAVLMALLGSRIFRNSTYDDEHLTDNFAESDGYLPGGHYQNSQDNEGQLLEDMEDNQLGASPTNSLEAQLDASEEDDALEDNQSDYSLEEEYDYAPETPETPVPVFTSEPLPQHIIDQITGVTFHDNTPFEHDFLTYLTVTHANFEDESVIGHLIVAAELGEEVLDIFREIYEYRFPIYSIRLIDYYDACDQQSMAANNSHAFNFRYIAGTTRISNHGWGRAIDINPIQNPYIRGYTIWPYAGAVYLDRSYVRPGMIVPGDVVYTAFTSRGWIWGGHWTLPVDFHHFERR